MRAAKFKYSSQQQIILSLKALPYWPLKDLLAS